MVVMMAMVMLAGSMGRSDRTSKNQQSKQPDNQMAHFHVSPLSLPKAFAREDASA
jgi:hypothetical protein